MTFESQNRHGRRNKFLAVVANTFAALSISSAMAQSVVVTEVRVKDQRDQPVYARVEFISYTDQTKIYRAIETNTSGVAFANQTCDSDYRIRIAPSPDIYIPIGLQHCKEIVEVPAKLPATVSLFLQRGNEAFEKKQYGSALLFASQAAEIAKDSPTLAGELLKARELGAKSAAEEFGFTIKRTPQGSIFDTTQKQKLSQWQQIRSLPTTGEFDFRTQSKLHEKYSSVPASLAIQKVITEAYDLQSPKWKP